jgi:hypothetical protein
MRTSARLLAGAALAFAMTASAHAAQYCCPCKSGQPQTVDASDDLKASFECTVACKRLTVAHPGACEAPAPAPATAPPAAPAAASGGVLLYKSEDCSGDAVRADKSMARLEGGAFRSFAVESGAPASVFAQADYAGSHTEPVGASICLSPGFDIASVRVGN